MAYYSTWMKQCYRACAALSAAVGRAGVPVSRYLTAGAESLLTSTVLSRWQPHPGTLSTWSSRRLLQGTEVLCINHNLSFWRTR